MKNGNNNGTGKLEPETPVNTALIVRRARLSDVSQMMDLLNEYARQMEILARAERDVYQSIREWIVVEVDGKVAGMGALAILWGDLAEIRSLVVDPAWHGQGFGRKIVTALLVEAKALNLPTVFALTRKAGFFLKLGFGLTVKERMPRKVMKDCVFCPKFQACDEVAVQMNMAAFSVTESQPMVSLMPVE